MKVKYNFFKNWGYAIKGLCDVFKNETSFRIELFFVFIFSVINFLLSIDIAIHLLLEIVLFGVLITEILNSAIERIVDFISPKFNELAGKIKDAGSAAVFFSIILALFCWVYVLVSIIFK